MQLDDLLGLWRRSLLLRAGGLRDTRTTVHWLQGATLYADLRQPPGLPDLRGIASLDELSFADCTALAEQEGFAGRLRFDGTHFIWMRRIDYQPASASADAGSLEWDAEVLVERGRDADYLEHWHRDAARHTVPAAAAVLESRYSPACAILVRVGPRFMYARDRATPLPVGRSLRDCVAAAPCVDAARAMIDCEISLGRVTGRDWRIMASTLPHRVGRCFDQRPRCGWEIVESEGNIDHILT